MRFRWIFVGVGALLLLSLGVWRWQSKSDASFEGRSARAWQQDLSSFDFPRSLAAQQAFRSMGSAGSDFLRQELAARDSRAKRLLMSLDKKVSWVNIRWQVDSNRRQRALESIMVLKLHDKFQEEIFTAFADTSVEMQLQPYEPLFVAMGNAQIPVIVDALHTRLTDSEREKLLLRLWRVMLLRNPPDEAVTRSVLLFCIKRLEKTSATSEPTSVGSVAAHAAWTIAACGAGAEPAVPALLQVCRSSDELAQVAAAEALIVIAKDPGPVVPVLIPLLKHRRVSGRVAAARGLSRYGVAAASAVPALRVAAGDPEPSVAVAVASALRRIGPEARSAAPELAACLASKHLIVRIGATLALAKINPEPSVVLPALIQGLKDESLDVRTVAADCLGELQAEAAPAIEPLIAALQTNPERVQASVIEALGKIGPAASNAAPHVRAAWNNNQSGLGKRAAEALARIEPHP